MMAWVSLESGVEQLQSVWVSEPCCLAQYIMSNFISYTLIHCMSLQTIVYCVVYHLIISLLAFC